MTTDTYMKNYCASMDRLEQLEKALDGLDLFMDIWESSFGTVAPDGLDKTLWDVQASAHIYLDGFRAALAEPVEIPAKTEQPTREYAEASATDVERAAADFLRTWDEHRCCDVAKVNTSE